MNLHERKIMEDFVKKNHPNLSSVKKALQKQLDLSSYLFPAQLAFVRDPASKKVAITSRRAGKSQAAAHTLIECCHNNPDSTAVYFGLTRTSARDILWKVIEDLNYRHNLQAEPRLVDLHWVFPNGSKIVFVGADKHREIDKVRGQGFRMAVIDEAGHFGSHLNTLAQDVLLPALGDYEDSQLILIGTPGPIPDGLFYEITEGKKVGWSVHHWTVLDNRYYPRWANKPSWRERAELYLELVKEENGWTDSTGIYLREYKGIWSSDCTDRVTKFDYGKNTFDELPKEQEYNFIIGVDFGIVDATAITIGAYSPNDPCLYIVDSFKQNQLPPEEVAKKVKAYWDLYAPVACVADSGGIGKAFLSQIQSMYSLPIRPAAKNDKIGFIELMNDDFVRGHIKVQRVQGDLIKELINLTWKDPKRRILQDKAEDHGFDSLLYLWREAKHWLFEPVRKEPKFGTAEYYEAEEQAYLNALDETLTKEWWDK